LDRSVVVTGCGSGIGRAIIERLADDGYYSVGVELDKVKAASVLNHLGERGTVVQADVRDIGELRRAASEATDHASLTGWVNNVGVALGAPLHRAEQDDVSAVLEINLMSHFWGSRVAIETFIEQGTGGSIVNISSIHGRAAFNGWAAYDTAKGGVDALTRYIAVEYGPIGVRANAIAPGAIRTDMVRDVIAASRDPEREERDMSALHPLDRLGEPAEVAAVAAFLLSEESSFLSGQSIAVDGAATARCYRYEPDPTLLAKFASARHRHHEHPG
jgi:NAD(P)-dependent dehydrogenase (short-subunit alcohol dehydrogenase family)